VPRTLILIRNDGKIVVEGIDYVGEECLRDLQRLQEALRQFGVDVDIVEQHRKPEAYITSQQEVEQHG